MAHILSQPNLTTELKKLDQVKKQQQKQEFVHLLSGGTSLCRVFHWFIHHRTKMTLPEIREKQAL